MPDCNVVLFWTLPCSSYDIPSKDYELSIRYGPNLSIMVCHIEIWCFFLVTAIGLKGIYEARNGARRKVMRSKNAQIHTPCVC